jgi:hypothetical protein
VFNLIFFYFFFSLDPVRFIPQYCLVLFHLHHRKVEVFTLGVFHDRKKDKKGVMITLYLYLLLLEKNK